MIQLLPIPLVITVEEIWPYAAAAGTIIGGLAGAFYANLLTQIRDSKEDVRLLRAENEQLRETIRLFTPSVQSLATTAVETKGMMLQLIAADGTVRRGRGTP